MSGKIDCFQGDHRFLSNFWPSQVRLKGELYPSVEAAYQAAKTTDLEARRPLQSATAGQAKRMGRKLPLRDDWDDIKLEVMEGLLRQKFASGTPLSERLLSTGDKVLVEGNNWGDDFWGVCQGRGLNQLGRLLMKIRKELQDGQK